MIDSPFIECDVCKARLYEYSDEERKTISDARLIPLMRAMVICGDCLSKFGKNSIIDNIRFEDLPK